jgi:regulator of protease activity HflC (stomatin/prohibitin superfamily)
MPYAGTNIDINGQHFEAGDDISGLTEEELEELSETPGAVLEDDPAETEKDLAEKVAEAQKAAAEAADLAQAGRPDGRLGGVGPDPEDTTRVDPSTNPGGVEVKAKAEAEGEDIFEVKPDDDEPEATQMPAGEDES